MTTEEAAASSTTPAVDVPTIEYPGVRPAFVVLLGIDGSGKSSLIQRLELPKLVATDWRELRNYELPQMLVPDAPTHIKAMLPSLSRAMFIGGHLVAQYEYLVRPRLAAGYSVALDSYYFKLLEKERMLGFAHTSLEFLCQELPHPDICIFIDVPPEVSYRRRNKSISPYEYYNDGSEDDYVQFQSDLRERLLETVCAQSEHVIVDGDCSEDELLERVTTRLEAVLAVRGTEPIETDEAVGVTSTYDLRHPPARVTRKSVTPFGDWFAVESQTLQLASGAEILVHVVEFPDIAVVVALDGDSVILLEQLRFPVREWILEAPAGRLDRGEVPVEAAKRELLEETGYQAGRIRSLGQIRVAPHLSTEVTHVFEATDLIGGEARPEKGELVRTLKVPIWQLRTLIGTHRLVDAKTISALVLAGLI